MGKRQGELGARLWRILLLGRLLRFPGCRNVPGPSKRIFLEVRKRWRRRAYEYVGPGDGKRKYFPEYYVHLIEYSVRKWNAFSVSVF